MEILKAIGNPQWWRSLMGTEFNQGFMAALILILALILTLLIMRGILFLIFRTRRCSSIVVKRADGDTVVSRDVISSVIDRELAAYPALSTEKILLTRKGSKYQLTIYCRYLLSDQAGMSTFCDEFKPRLLAALDKGFGIKSLDRICFWVSSPEDGDYSAPPAAAESKDAYIGL